MKMIMGLAIAATVAMLTLSIALAGWDHVQKQTIWVDRPTAATCWLRAKGVLYPARVIQVYNDTIRTHNSGGTAVTQAVDTGYWYIVTDGTSNTLVNYSFLTSQMCPTNTEGTMNAPGEWFDCEWIVNMDGDLVGKE